MNYRSRVETQYIAQGQLHCWKVKVFPFFALFGSKLAVVYFQIFPDIIQLLSNAMLWFTFTCCGTFLRAPPTSTEVPAVPISPTIIGRCSSWPRFPGCSSCPPLWSCCPHCPSSCSPPPPRTQPPPPSPWWPWLLLCRLCSAAPSWWSWWPRWLPSTSPCESIPTLREPRSSLKNFNFFVWHSWKKCGSLKSGLCFQHPLVCQVLKWEFTVWSCNGALGTPSHRFEEATDFSAHGTRAVFLAALWNGPFCSSTDWLNRDCWWSLEKERAFVANRPAVFLSYLLLWSFYDKYKDQNEPNKSAINWWPWRYLLTSYKTWLFTTQTHLVWHWLEAAGDRFLLASVWTEESGDLWGEYHSQNIFRGASW